MSKFYMWILRKYLDTITIGKDESLIIAIKSEVTQKQLEEMAKVIKKTVGDRVVLIGDVDNIIVAN